MRERIYLLLAVIFWGTSFVFTKILLEFVTPIELMGLRFMMGVPFLYVIILKKRLVISIERKDYKKFIIGSSIITLHFFIQISGLKYTSATNTGWIISVTPLVLAVLSYVILKERIGRNGIIGIIVATIGIILLVSKGNLSNLDWLSSIGDWLVLISAHTWALYTVATRDLSRKYKPIIVIFSILLPSAIITLTYMLFTSDWSKFLHLSFEATVALLILGFLSMGTAQWFWQEGVAKFGAAKAGFFLYLEPVATTCLAVPYLHEHFGLYTAIGGLMVLGGVYIAEKKVQKK